MRKCTFLYWGMLTSVSLTPYTKYIHNLTFPSNILIFFSDICHSLNDRFPWKYAKLITLIRSIEENLSFRIDNKNSTLNWYLVHFFQSFYACYFVHIFSVHSTHVILFTFSFILRKLLKPTTKIYII